MEIKYYLDRFRKENSLKVNDEGDMANYLPNEIYKLYRDDQVLTAGQLNKNTEHFEEQLRLNRTNIVGTGILNGFEVELNGKIIKIFSGCGITTDGDLFVKENINQFQDQDSGGYKPVLAFNTSIEFKDELGYFKNVQGPIQELQFSPGGSFKTDVSDKIVLIYLENYDEEPGLCSATNCDNEGATRYEKYHFLLLGAEQVLKLIGDNTYYERYKSLVDLRKSLETLEIEKIVLNKVRGDFSILEGKYIKAIDKAEQLLHTSIDTIRNANIDIPDLNKKTFISPASTNPFSTIQYNYDFIRDALEAYNEIVQHIRNNVIYCCPNQAAFPKHLLAGMIKDSSEFRDYFYPSSSLVSIQKTKEKLLFLIERYNELILNFNHSLNGPKFIREVKIGITPSKLLRSTLGERAIPYYYNNVQNLAVKWDFQNLKYEKSKNYLSAIRSVNNSNEFYEKPQNYSVPQHDFYRIEGHLGKNEEDVKKHLQTVKESMGFSFGVLSFSLNSESFMKFVKQHTSAEHFAGTWVNGTFIIIINESKVIADFCLPYRVEESNGQADCCKVITASYPWISSLKYMNNLARTVNSTKQLNKPVNYRLKITKYSIGGHRLDDYKEVIIDVPIKNIYNRRLHAVAEAINKKFPKGLVFDYNEDRKRLNITRIKGHNFIFEIKDITLKENESTYTFTNNRVFKDGKPYTYGKVIETFYVEDEYQQLQSKYAPKSKDDDYGSYYFKWKEYYSLVESLKIYPDRSLANPSIITNSASLSVVYNIKQLYTAIIAQDNGAIIYLIGDWANGTWVSKEMLDLNDVLVRRFIKLRAELLHETNASDLSVMVIPSSGSSFNITDVKNKLEFNVNILIGKDGEQEGIDITGLEDDVI